MTLNNRGPTLVGTTRAWRNMQSEISPIDRRHLPFWCFTITGIPGLFTLRSYAASRGALRIPGTHCLTLQQNPLASSYKRSIILAQRII